MKGMVILFFCCTTALGALAQHDLGLWNSNYAGIQGSLLNPSSIAGSRLDWDIHVFSVNVDFANNFLYAPKSAVPILGIQRIIKGSIDENLFLTRYDPQNPNKLYNVSFSSTFLGPSFFVKIRKKHEIGLSSGDGCAHNYLRKVKKIARKPCSARMHVPCSPRRISQLLLCHRLQALAHSAVWEGLPRWHHRIDVTAARLKPKDSVWAITVSVNVASTSPK